MANKTLILCALWLAAGVFFSPAASQNPESLLRQHLGNVKLYLEQGRFLNAFEEAKAARRCLSPGVVAPDSLAAQTHFWLGRCYTSLVRTGLAIEQLDSALHFAGEQASALRYSIDMYLGAARREEQRIRAAIEYFGSGSVESPQMLAESYLALGAFFLQKNKGEEAADALQQSLSIFEAQGKESSSKARCLQLIGYYYWRFERKFVAAQEYFRDAETIFVQLGGTESDHLAALYINLGGCLDDMGEIGEAIKRYKISEQKLLAIAPDHAMLVNLYNNFGNSYSALGEYATAVQYLEKVTTIDSTSGRYWNNLGDAYLNQGNWQMSERCFNKALLLLPSSEKRNLPEIARPLHNLAIIYRQRGQLDSALHFELRSIPLRKTSPQDLLGIARSYLGAGECYLALQKYPEALLYLDSALWLQSQALPSRIFAETASAFGAKARLKAELGDFEAAFNLIDSALYASGYAGDERWNEVTAPTQLLTALEQKAALAFRFYENTKEEKQLEQALQWYDTAAQAVRHFRNTLLNNESKATLAGQFRSILSGGVEAALALHRLHPEAKAPLRQAFAFSEQSKALVLLEGVRNAGNIKFEGIPDSVLERERRLREAVTEAETLLKKLLDKGAALSDNRVADAKNLIFNRQRDFERFQQQLAEGEFSDYFNFRYGFALAAPEEVQSNLLRPSSAMLSYFVLGNNRLVAFVLRKNDFQAVECSTRLGLDTLIRQLREGLFGYYTLSPSKRDDDLFEKTILQFSETAQWLYQDLIAPVEPLLGEEIIIVPDGALGYIPFELLLSEAPAQPLHFGEYAYWFKAKNKSISYSYSATLLREMSQKQHKIPAGSTLFAMAPLFPGNREDAHSGKPIEELSLASTPGFGKKKFKPLPYSGEELRDICSIWNGRYELGKEAGKALFLREAPRFQILHLSTHGVLDNKSEFSFLAFAPAPGEREAEPLYVRDLYNAQLNADLVTLSACETGIGEFQRGEGVISLARAFAYAGAKSIVTTLWQVDNAATKDLMRNFYQNLHAEIPKDQALRKAKIQFLAEHPGEQSHPFFWAGLVGLGDMQPIRQR